MTVCLRVTEDNTPQVPDRHARGRHAGASIRRPAVRRMVSNDMLQTPPSLSSLWLCLISVLPASILVATTPRQRWRSLTY